VRQDVELALALHACRPAVVVAPVLAVVFGVTRGPGAAWAAAVGVAIVAADLLASGGLLSLVVRWRPGLLGAAALLGFVLRLAVVTLALILLSRATGMDRLAAAASVVAAYVVMMVWESVAIARRGRRGSAWGR
jgi:hypothetical protein